MVPVTGWLGSVGSKRRNWNRVRNERLEFPDLPNPLIVSDWSANRPGPQNETTSAALRPIACRASLAEDAIQARVSASSATSSGRAYSRSSRSRARRMSTRLVSFSGVTMPE